MTGYLLCWLLELSCVEFFLKQTISMIAVSFPSALFLESKIPSSVEQYRERLL
jgi:hypothetical protein